MKYCKECGKTEDQVGKWVIAEELPRDETLDKLIKEQTEKAIIEEYRKQLSLYTKEEKKVFNDTIEYFLEDKDFPKEVRQAVGYFYLRLHVLENDFIK